MRILKKITILVAVATIFMGCTGDSITKEECVNQGKKYKVTEVLNLRTGKYEEKAVCSN